MFGPNQSSRGRVVYGNGSFAPTRGQVSAAGAQGYMRRELNKNRVVQGPYSTQPVGQDGQSDRRSGLGTPRTRTRMAPGGGAPKPPKKGITRDYVPGNEGSKPPKKPAKKTTKKSPSPPPKPAPPKIVISPTGTISFPMGQYGPEIESALADYNQELLSLNAEDQQNALDYQQALRDASMGYDSQKLNTLNDSASRGVALSSGYSQAVANNQNVYDNAVNSLNQANTNSQSNNAARRAAIYDSFNRQLADSVRAAGSSVENPSDYGTQPKPSPTKKSASSSSKPTKDAGPYASQPRPGRPKRRRNRNRKPREK